MENKSSQTLTDKIVVIMRQRIFEGQYLAGAKLSEVALCKNMQISRNTLREAFRILTKDGLLSYEPNRGVYVSIPDISSIMDIYNVRRIIECQGILNISSNNHFSDDMNAAIISAKKYVENDDWKGVGTANLNFHMAIAALNNSERINAMFSKILAELRLIFGLIDDAKFLHKPYIDININILELFKNKEFDKCAELLKESLINSERLILSVYAQKVSKI